eukprot:3091618-Alexandrium_andersonii.AAC.1
MGQGVSSPRPSLPASTSASSLVASPVLKGAQAEEDRRAHANGTLLARTKCCGSTQRQEHIYN